MLDAGEACGGPDQEGAAEALEIRAETRGRRGARAAGKNRIGGKHRKLYDERAASQQEHLRRQRKIGIDELRKYRGEVDEKVRVGALRDEASKKGAARRSRPARLDGARRLVERGARFVQLYHTEWDHHGGAGENLNETLNNVTREIDRPCAALIKDLKRRGLLEDTLVVWGGEFGRTPMGEQRETLGRNHHIDAYTMWFAGGGIKPGQTIGATDEFGFFSVEDKVHVHDIQATILHLLGIDHTELTFKFQGRDFRLTDVSGEVIHKMLA
jgi:uncharacterized protein (DUF1501 family)